MTRNQTLFDAGALAQDAAQLDRGMLEEIIREREGEVSVYMDMMRTTLKFCRTMRELMDRPDPEREKAKAEAKAILERMEGKKMEPFIIQAVTAFVAEDPPGTEGIMAWKAPSGWMPLIGADASRIKDLTPMARAISEQTGKPFKVLRFSTRTDITESF